MIVTIEGKKYAVTEEAVKDYEELTTKGIPVMPVYNEEKGFVVAFVPHSASDKEVFIAGASRQLASFLKKVFEEDTTPTYPFGEKN